MKLSARNQIRGTIVALVKGATTIVSSITSEAVDELALQKGKSAIVVIKASDVMIGVE